MSFDPWAANEGNRMFVWLQETLEKWDADPKIVWRVSAQHHPMFGKWYQDSDHLTMDLLPLLMKYNFDLYLNGHEHVLTYSYYPYSQIDYEESFEGFECRNDVESLFGRSSRESIWN